MTKKVLFVCLGNICRSPAAHGIAQHLLAKYELSDKVLVDSAGTNGYHNGELPDERMRHWGAKRGYQFDSLSRQVTLDDLASFDFVLAMDKRNQRDLKALDKNGEFHHKIELMMKYAASFSEAEVPDPYYGGDDGFQLVLDMLEDACDEFFKIHFLQKR